MSDIVNDDCKAARVRIDGAVNGRSFTVERTTRRRALWDLFHFLHWPSVTESLSPKGRMWCTFSICQWGDELLPMSLTVLDI